MPLLPSPTRGLHASAAGSWSRFLEPCSEATDALCVPDWAQSRCPACGDAHREVLFVHPPSALVRPTLAKAMADRTLCALLVPVAILAPHWSKLLAALVLPRRAPYADGFLRVRDPSRALTWPDPHGPAELALFVCDFSRLQPRAALPQLSSCPGATARLPRPACGSSSDALDRHRLHEALQAQHGGPH